MRSPVHCATITIVRYGSARCLSQALALCRSHLHAVAPDISSLLTDPQRSALNRSCPQCKRGTMRVIARCSTPEPATPKSLLHSTIFDSS